MLHIKICVRRIFFLFTAIQQNNLDKLLWMVISCLKYVLLMLENFEQFKTHAIYFQDSMIPVHVSFIRFYTSYLSKIKTIAHYWLWNMISKCAFSSLLCDFQLYIRIIGRIVKTLVRILQIADEFLKIPFTHSYFLN